MCIVYIIAIPGKLLHVLSVDIYIICYMYIYYMHFFILLKNKPRVTYKK